MKLLLALPLLWADDLTTRGFEHFYNLEFDEAIAIFEQAVRRNPGDPQAHNHVAQGILYREMLRAGSLESELVTGTNPFIRREKLKPSVEDQRRFDVAVAKALELTENASEAKGFYARGVALGLRGNYNFLVKKAWRDALHDLTTGRKLHNRVTEMDPGWVDAKLMQGLHDYVVGSLPWGYKILGFLIGFRGDKEGGIRTLQEVAAKGNDNRMDAEVMLAVVYRRERRPETAIPLLRDLIARYPRNYLFRLEMVQMYSDSGDKDRALAELAGLDELKRRNTPGMMHMPAEKVNAARGTLLFWYREYDQAIVELKRAVKGRDLDLNTLSMAWLRMGQSYDMKQKREEAVAAYRQANTVAPDSDAARQSREYTAKPYRRPVDN